MLKSTEGRGHFRQTFREGVWAKLLKGGLILVGRDDQNVLQEQQIML